MLIFLCPAIMDAVVFLVLFAVSYGAGARGMSTWQCACLGGVFQLTYMVSSMAVGLVLNRRNARPILLASIGLGTVSAMFALALDAFWPLIAAMSFFGVAMAGFFNAFQTFMRGEAAPGGLARTTALYTASWSGGSAAGFLASGSLYNLGDLPLVLLALAVGAVMFVLLSRHPMRPGDTPSADEHVEDPRLARQHEAYVGVAWVMIFTAMFVQRPLQTFVPAFGGKAGVAAALVSLPLALHMLLQAVSGGLMIRVRHWLYRPGILAAVQLLAAGLLLVLWRLPVYGFTAAGISVLGLWSGFMYFCAVFYASNAGNRSRNIGVNECLVGLGSFAGLFATEYVMKKVGDDQAMYLVCATALAASVGLQLVLARRVKPAAARP